MRSQGIDALFFLAILGAILLHAAAPAYGAAVPSDPTRIKSPADLPPGAAPEIAKALLRDLPAEYQLRESGSGFSMANPLHDMQITFTTEGPRFTVGERSLSMTLSGIGSPDSVRPVQPAVLSNEDGRIVYARGDISEWYINSEWGVEQGFTVHRAPRRAGKQLAVELSLAGDLRPGIQGENLVLADGTGRDIIRYSGLRVFDADGRMLPAHLALAGNTLSILVDESRASYPLTIDPWFQKAKITPDDAAAGNLFGSSVAVSGDTIVVGAPAGFSPGCAYVFQKATSGWANTIQKAKLIPSDSDYLNFEQYGASVAISGDTIVVGMAVNPLVTNKVGTAYVFVRPADGWADMTETARLTSSDGVLGDNFGTAVAISGETIVVSTSGLSNPIYPNPHPGSAYVFVRPQGGWTDMTQTAKLSASDGTKDDQFGVSVAISGGAIVAGAHLDDDLGTDSGSAYVFVRPERGWSDMTQTAKLTASDGFPGARFGHAVATSGDTVVVGTLPPLNGSAYVFVRPGTGWADMTQTAKISSLGGHPSAFFGYSVAIDGDTIVVGARDEVVDYAYRGAAYVFVRPESGWSDMTQTVVITARDGAADDAFGGAVAVSGDAIVVGAHCDDDNGTCSGSAYIFDPRNFWPMFLPALQNSARQ